MVQLEKTTCGICGTVLAEGDGEEVNGNRYCSTCFQRHYFTCTCCGEVFNRNEQEPYIYQNEAYCLECFETEFVECEDCGEIIPREEAIHVSGYRDVCENCAQDYAVCDSCGELVDPDETEQDENGTCLCRSCFDNYYFRCPDCGNIVHWEYRFEASDGQYYCEDCYYNNHDETAERVIRNYHDGPELCFHSIQDGSEKEYFGINRYFGIELEIGNGGESDENAAILLDLLGNNHFHAEHDGSVASGFELVSQPMTIGYLQREIFPKLPEFCKKAVAMGYRGHKASSSCGLHVHVSKTSFTAEQVAEIILLMEKFWTVFLKFSRRTQHALDRWAARYDLDEDGSYTAETTLEKALSILKKRSNRYKALNITNSSTIEFRLFRSSLLPETIEATILFVAWLCDYVTEYDADTINNLTTFPTEGLPEEVKNYMIKRGILITEPEEVEI